MDHAFSIYFSVSGVPSLNMAIPNMEGTSWQDANDHEATDREATPEGLKRCRNEGPVVRNILEEITDDEKI